MTAEYACSNFLPGRALIHLYMLVAIRLFILAGSLLFIIDTLVPATASGNSQRSQSHVEKLAAHPLWLKLLHFNTPKNRSDISSTDFFLSSNGQQNPQDEMLATIQAYSEPWLDDTNAHPRCRFPARFLWLSQHIPLPDYTERPPQCTRLEKWASFDPQQSISLLLVSGYLGNPASTFGHSLLKFNTASSAEKLDLLNASINFGARVPPGEFPLVYVFKGIFGGYRAGFSDKYFYAQDIVYSRTEFRDMWEYELVLPEFERTLLMFHIWEVVGKEFTYFFLKENCAYRLAELLELVLPEPLLDNPKLWYIPAETFHRLREVDRERRQKGEPGLILSSRFIPSSQRELYHQFARLHSAERHAVTTIIQEGPASIPEQLALFPQERQLEVLDTVLAYHKYKIIADQPSPDREQLAVKDQVLLAQLRLPPQTEAMPDVPAVRSPADGNRPMLLSVGAGYESGGEDTHFTVRWAPFSQESIGRNSLEGDELVMLDTTIGIDGNRPALFVDTFDLIRLRKLKTTFMAFGDENPWSWQLRIGMLRTREDDASRYDGMFRFGTGRAWAFANSVSAYALVDASAHTLAPYARLRPHAGMTLGNDAVKSWWYAGVESNDYAGNFTAVWGGHIQYALADQLALLLAVSQENTTKISFELRSYW